MPVDNLHFYLEKLENVLNLEHVKRTKVLQKRTFSFEPIDHIPTVISYPILKSEWPLFDFKEILSDVDKMLLSELRNVYMGAKIQDDRLYGIRANYGTGIIASMFGCPIHTFKDALPIGKEVSSEQIDQILENGVPDLQNGLMSQVYETVAYFREQLQAYEKLSKTIGSQCFDIQGPFDNASIIWGSEIYLAVKDTPEKLVRLMEIISETILLTVEKLREIDNQSREEHDGAWNYLGSVCVRNDSTVNLGKEHYVNLIKQFDEKIMSRWGGWIHFCGRAHQWWQELLDIKGMMGINPYQGEFYNLFNMFEMCENAKVPIVQWTVPVNKKCRERIKTGFSRIIEFKSFEEACRARDRLHKTGHVDQVD
jgi:hypothetical protein